MKHQIILEQIIRKSLTEGAIITDYQAITLDSTNNEVVDSIRNDVIPTQRKSEINFNSADGIAIDIKRRGGRTDDTSTENNDKQYELTEGQLRDNVISSLNKLRGAYLPMTKTDYVWIVDMTDRIKPKEKKKKEEQIVAKYQFVAVYIKRSLLNKTIDESSKGFQRKLDGGALVFLRNLIDIKQWKATGRIETDVPTQSVGIAKIPGTSAKYGDSNPFIKQLYSYFYEPMSNEDRQKTIAPESTYYTTLDKKYFGCELRSACMQFQEETNIEKTGEWDAITIQKATDLYNLKSEANPEYKFKNLDALKQKIQDCRKTNKLSDPFITPISADLQYTNDEIIKATSTSTYSDITKYFQNYLVNVIKNKTNSAIQTKLNGTGQYYTKVANDVDGKWGPNSKALTTNYKKLTKLSPANGNVTSEFIKSLKDLNSQGATVKTESRILSNKIILEQVTFDLTVDTKTTSNAVDTETPLKDKDTKVIKKSADTVKKQDVDAYKKVASLPDEKTVKFLIRNAVQFIDELSSNPYKQSDWERRYEIINNRMLGRGDTYKTAYIDMILRIASSSWFATMRNKYSKEYNYFISRNGSVGTTWEYLEDKSTRYARAGDSLNLKGLNYLFYGESGEFLYLDDISDKAVVRQLSKLRTISSGYKWLSKIPAEMPLKLRYTTEQIHKKIINIYKSKLFGNPK